MIVNYGKFHKHLNRLRLCGVDTQLNSYIQMKTMKSLIPQFFKYTQSLKIFIPDNPCTPATDCSECMQADPMCAWCLNTVSLK